MILAVQFLHRHMFQARLAAAGTTIANCLLHVKLDVSNAEVDVLQVGLASHGEWLLHSVASSSSLAGCTA